MKSRYNGYSFPVRDTVLREKVHFHNRYGIELVGDLYMPKGAVSKLAAIAVAGPFGAVKEQCAGLYAEELASRGFAALAFDPSFIGESGGQVRNVASPDINTEDFSAAALLKKYERGGAMVVQSAKENTAVPGLAHYVARSSWGSAVQRGHRP